jgi:hypothetical protein
MRATTVEGIRPACFVRAIGQLAEYYAYACQYEFESASGPKKRPQLSGASWGRVGLEMYRMGENRHGSDVGLLSAIAIKLRVRVA